MKEKKEEPAVLLPPQHPERVCSIPSGRVSRAHDERGMRA